MNQKRDIMVRVFFNEGEWSRIQAEMLRTNKSREDVIRESAIQWLKRERHKRENSMPMPEDDE